MKSIAVFCGANNGSSPAFTEQAALLGKMLAERNITLVYGGSRLGIMGAVANGALQHGGTVIGVIPNFLKTKEVAHDGITEMIVVDTMHERKLRMHELSTAVITLPGGFGTMEELFEMITWAQLGLHQKPIGILNTEGYYDDLIQLTDKMMAKGLLRKVYHDMLLVDETIDGLIEKMQAYKAPDLPQWITEEES